MDKDTQLPAAVLEEIKEKATMAMDFLSNDESVTVYELKGYKNGWVAGATEFAKEIKELKQWKKEAIELLQPILDYGQSKEAGIPLGENITKVVLERCKQAKAARTLLKQFISRHEAGLLPDMFIYNEIKTFLDGK